MQAHTISKSSSALMHGVKLYQFEMSAFQFVFTNKFVSASVEIFVEDRFIK